MTFPPVLWGFLVTVLWILLTQVLMATVYLAGVRTAPLIEMFAFVVATALVLQADVRLRPKGMPGVGLRLSRPGLLVFGLIAGVGLAILASEIDNVVSDRFPRDNPLAVANTSDVLPGSDWLRALSVGLVWPIARVLVTIGISLRCVLVGLPLEVALVLTALTFAVFGVDLRAGVPLAVPVIVAGWAYTRSRAIALPIAILLPVFSSVWISVLDLPLSLPGFYPSGDGGPVVFQPLWFDVLGIVLLAVGVGLLIRAFEGTPTLAALLPRRKSPGEGSDDGSDE